jgi:hypothetical protein
MALKAVFIAAAFLRPGIAMADPIDRWASEIVSASDRGFAG